MAHYDYDVIVIGGGSGGLTVAIGTAGVGKRTLMINEGYIGGDCTNTGCVVSKSALHYIITHSGATLYDTLSHAHTIRNTFRQHSSPTSLASQGIEYVSGRASFIDSHTIRIIPSTYPYTQPGSASSSLVGEKIVTGKKIVISTGAHARTLHIPGVPQKNIHTYETIFSTTHVRTSLSHLVIIGGGYIACEVADCYVRCGIHVTMIVRSDRLLSHAEPTSSDAITSYLRSLGVTIYTHTTVQEGTNNTLTLQTTCNKGNADTTTPPSCIPYDCILLAIGREPTTKYLALHNASIAYNKTSGGIITTPGCVTSQSHIYAIGDCVHNNPQFSHWTNHQGRTVVTRLVTPLPLWQKTPHTDHCPRALYTHYEIGQIGMTSSQLDTVYGTHNYTTIMVGMEDIDKAIMTNTTQGYLRIHVSPLRGRVLGATITGPGASDILTYLTFVYTNNISLYRVAQTIAPYPTRSAIVKKAADKYIRYTLANWHKAVRSWIQRHSGALITATLWLCMILGMIWIKHIRHVGRHDIGLGVIHILRTPYRGPLMYIIAYAIRPLLLVPASFLTTLSGYLFGPIGILFTAIGENISASVAYMLGKYFGRSFVNPHKRGVINNLAQRLNDGNTFLRVLMMRLVGIPFDIVNYGCGILHVPRIPYMIATCIGIIPGMISFVMIGNAFDNVDSFSWTNVQEHADWRMMFFGVGLFCICIVITKLWERRSKCRRI